LAFEAPADGVLNGLPETANQPFLGPQNRRTIGREGLALASGPLVVSALGRLRHGGGSAEAQTMAFGSLVTAQLLHALSCRRSERSSTEALPPPNRVLTGILAGSFVAQGAAYLTPAIRRLLGVSTLSGVDLALTALGGSLAYLCAGGFGRDAGRPGRRRNEDLSGEQKSRLLSRPEEAPILPRPKEHRQDGVHHELRQQL
jgi:Ca2+-transporting ATPase